MSETIAGLSDVGRHIASLREKAEYYEIAGTRERCEDNLSEFVRNAWPTIDNAPFVSCWAIDAMCDHLEAVTSGHIKRLLINIPPRCAKPVSEDAIVLTKRGLIKLADVVVGDLVWTHKARWRSVTAIHKQGILPVFKISTWTGREVEAAADHPFLTPSGWVDVRDLNTHDVLGLVPLHANHDQCGAATMSVEEARLLGYLVGDGSCGGTPNITCGDDRGAADMMHCARMMGFDPKEYKYKITKTGKWLRRISLRGKHPITRTKKDYLGPVRAWIKGHCLDHKSSYTKMVPDAVLRGSNDIVAAFVGAYWSCDGFVGTKGPKRDGTQRDDLVLGCDSVNRAFLVQVQMLLMRLGINSRLRKKTANIVTKRQGDSYVSWTLVISTQDDAWRFADRIKFFHEKYDKLIGARKRRFDFDRYLIGDSIESIEPSSSKECRCLTVEEDLSFTANGFAVHNTSVCSIIYPAWTWARSEITFLSGPQVKFLCASYNHPLSLDSSNKSRRMLFSPWYQKHWPNKIILQPDQNTKSQFDNLKGGSRIATSVGGQLLGLGGDIVICDDLNNTEKVNQKAPDTEADCEKVKTFWNEIHSTRLNDPRQSAVIVVQQRVRENDVSGIILDDEEEDFVHLMIPMRYDEQRHCVTVKLPQYDDDKPWEDPRQREGELMWPERFGEVEVRKTENALGPYMASGRLQQSPSPKGGGIIKRDWWQLWDQEEAQRYGLEWHGGLKEFPEFELVVGSLDTSYGEKQENDYNALTIWGIWIDKNKNRRGMLMFAWNKRLPLHGRLVSALPGEAKVNFEQRQKEDWGLVELVADTCKRYRVRRLLIENKTRGRDVANEINRLYEREKWGVELIEPVGDKVSRTHSIVPLFTDGCIWAPNTRWADAVITQCTKFPKDVHDDMHDTVTQFLNWAREGELLVRADEMSSALADEAKHKPQTQSVAQAYGV